MKWGLVVLGGFFGLTVMTGPASAKDAHGVWLTESKKAHVEIYDCDTKLCGKIVWLMEPNDDNGNPKLDKHNPNKAKQSAPLMGSMMISGMVRASSSMWKDGEIYDAEDGKAYASKMKIKDDKTLEVSGCVFFFCKTQIWLRVE